MAALAVAAATSSTALGAPSASTASRNVQATLVPEVESVRAGVPFWVGLHLRMAPEWHTYWKNPGDSGLPTRIRWSLPDRFAADPLLFPAPERIPAGPLMSYGYHGEVLLLSRITPPSGLVAGTTVRL